MTVLLLARTAVVTAVTGALLSAGAVVATAASADPDPAAPARSFTSPPASETAYLNAVQLTVPHGRRLG